LLRSWNERTLTAGLTLGANGATSCLWYAPKDQGWPAKSCSYKDKVLQLVTGADSTVRLTFGGDALRGTFTGRNGSAFTITMHRK
jgi:hypothetical protein